MADVSMERTADVMNHDAIGEAIDNEEAFRIVAEVSNEGPQHGMEQDDTDLTTGDDRLHAFAQHIVDASDHHLQNRDEHLLDQTLDEQQHAADLLGLAGSNVNAYEQVYSEGLSGLLEAQDRDRREEQNVDEHGYPLDRGIDGQHQSLDGVIYNDVQEGHMDGQQHQEEGQEGQEELYPQEDYAAAEKPARKRKRKEPGTGPDMLSKKSAHKEIERKRRANISAGVDSLAELLPEQFIKQKGQILQRAADYIRDLVDREVLRDQQIAAGYARKQQELEERWTLERIRLQEENENLTKTVEDLQNLLAQAENALQAERQSMVDQLTGVGAMPEMERTE